MKTKHLLVSILFFLLIGCQITTVRYFAPKTQTGHMCITQCRYMYQMCLMRYHLKNNQCLQSAWKEANFQYQAYVYEQELLKKAIHKNQSSFYDSYMCQYQGNCLEQYQTCFSHCGGKILVSSTPSIHQKR